jgi:hypothetical protein
MKKLDRIFTKKNKKYNNSQFYLLAADFETTTIFEENLERDINNKKLVTWLNCFVDIRKCYDMQEYRISTSTEEFFNQVHKQIEQQDNKDCIIYFHNLKFDGSYILNYFNEKEIEFDTFINDMGQWYSITYDYKDYKIVIRDSLKILNFSIKQIGKDMLKTVEKGITPLTEEKIPLDICYKKGYVDYVIRDVEILAKALNKMIFEQGFEKFTASSQALATYKEMISFSYFLKLFPPLKNDEIIRMGYRGGWTFANPVYQNKEIRGNINVYDKNSMYPAIMLNYKLPTGKPRKIEYEYTREKHDIIFKEFESCCYVYNLNVAFDIKDEHLPSIQIKIGNKEYFKNDEYFKEKILANKDILFMLDKTQRDYLTTSQGHYFNITLTNYDLDLMKRQYDFDILENSKVIKYEFSAKKGLFDKYINLYKDRKIEGKKIGNAVMTQDAKLKLNSLYGKFGTKKLIQEKEVYFEDDVLKFKNDLELTETTGVYVPLAMFVTSIGRWEIINNAQDNYNHFLYSDTDSLHLLDEGQEIKLNIDDYKFGDWKIEEQATRGKYLRAKLYIEELIDGSLSVRGAGMTDEIKKQVTFDNFKLGATFKGKRATKQIKGGVLIYTTTFSIKE